MKANSLLNFGFFFIAAVHLTAILAGDKFDDVVFLTKPLLVTSLIIIFYQQVKRSLNSFHRLIMVALAFSLLGDIILMFQENDATYFLIGLVSFLIAHICYIFAFMKTDRSQASFLARKPWLAILFVAYGIIFFLTIKNGLGEMMIPVILYECIILLMGITALNRIGRVENKSFVYVFVGALLFMLSDSLLAVNKFYRSFYPASFLIMLTYIAAQFFIVKGAAEQKINARA